jgi:hypothetical protein
MTAGNRWVAFALVACALAGWWGARRAATPHPVALTASTPAPITTAEPEPTPTTAQKREAKALVRLSERSASPARQRTALRGYLEGSGVSSPTIAAVMRHTRDGIALRPGPGDAVSRMGGRPVLPAGAKWPSDAGVPFTFVVALDLAELPHLDPLPRAGTLALYWNNDWVDTPGEGKMDFVAATRAYYLPPGAPVRHPAAPRATYPIKRKPLRGTVTPIAGDPNLVADEIKGRPDLDRLNTAMSELLAAGLYPHHLLGAPIEIQGPVLEGMRYYLDARHGDVAPRSLARFTAAERRSKDWVLLAQIEEAEDFVVADAGVLYFVMLRKDLEARRFDRVIGMMDSH